MKFFCAEASRQAGEDMIGSGTNYQTYVLIECHTPWFSNVFDSPQIPQNLKDLIEATKQSKQSIRFLLITQAKRKPPESIRILIYDQSQEAFSQGYEGWEFKVETIDHAADGIRHFLAGNGSATDRIQPQTRDILVCTHGSHDKCCAKYGLPFYREAINTLSNLNLNNVRVWQTSHFGGHRFAPTVIDLPDGRYYGGLDQPSFQAILTRTGDIRCFNHVYRGWGILPNPLQVLERELILRYGWNWFNYGIRHKIIEQNADKSVIQAEITFEISEGDLYTGQAELIKDSDQTLVLKGSCNAKQSSEFIKYAVVSFNLYAHPKPIKDSLQYPEKMAS
ncbi:MAG: sucrase ferredoxin [Cyanobacteria bacterium CRU_2_1]|nr:sucrase ferredoxin [Cyanobacteria bacterium RU_5_0]NJR59263.1 sucrase ferredoxin [Cyanobacteria bacterium CRU_2_1]